MYRRTSPFCWLSRRSPGPVSGNWCEFLRESVVRAESKMAEDVNLQSSPGYDEDLCENPFFKYMQTKQKQLYDEVASKRWTVSLNLCYFSARVLPKSVQNIICSEPVQLPQIRISVMFLCVFKLYI